MNVEEETEERTVNLVAPVPSVPRVPEVLEGVVVRVVLVGQSSLQSPSLFLQGLLCPCLPGRSDSTLNKVGRWGSTGQSGLRYRRGWVTCVSVVCEWN